MTTHVAYLVTLEEPVENNVADATLTALRRIKGVVSVDPVGDELELDIAKGSLRQKAFKAHMEAIRKVFGDG
jgi:hypothetical protein